MPSSSPPLVSVVIPCYNAERWVAEAIESALTQSYEPVEVIVVDDGSTDGSPGVIRSFGDEVAFLSTPDRGASGARNEGLERASGRYVKLLDADDRLRAGAVGTQVRAAEQLDEDEIVFGDGLYIDESGAVTGEVTYRPRRREENRLEYVMRMNPQTSMPLHRRELLRGVGGFDEDLPKAQEYDLHIRLALEGARFVHRPGPIAETRRHGGADRITNQDHFGRDPHGLMKRVRRREEWADEAGLLSEGVRRILAESAWDGGRRASRRKLRRMAERYFEYARRLDADVRPTGSAAYRLLARALGPYGAETVARATRPVRAVLFDE